MLQGKAMNKKRCLIGVAGSALACSREAGHAGQCEFIDAHDIPDPTVRYWPTPDEFFKALSRFEINNEEDNHGHGT
jgi:hypothetical protein